VNAYPAAYTACFAVAASNSADRRAYYSNYGTWVEAAAPGDAIRSSYPDGAYATLSGTSMAAPHVAGLAGLLASQGLSNSQIRDRICATSDPITGTGTSWSCGRINLARALQAANPAEQPPRAYLPAILN
jgi:subtilisin family serine protease